jgi:hypothetical protein
MAAADWDAIRDDYERGESLRSLASKYGVSKSAIGKRKYQEKWTQKVDKWTPPKYTDTKTDVNAAVRVLTALDILVQERPSWDEIAARAGYSSRGAAHNAVKRELERRITHDIAQLRDEELYMIQNMQARCYKAAMDEDNEGWTWAIDRFAVLSKRKSELMGMDVKPDAIPDGVTIIRNYNVEVGQV